MRFLHLADLHLGRSLNKFNLIEDQRFMLDQVVGLARSHKVNAVVLAGDLYDKSQPSAEAVALFDEFLTNLADAQIPCVAVAGNHDSAERVSYAGRLLARQGIHVAPVYDGTVTSWTATDEHGPVTFWLLPFLRPIDVRRALPDAAEAIGQDFTAATKAALDACPIDTAARNVLVAHQYVIYPGADVELSDSETVVGGLDCVDGHLFDRFDYVALGHIHTPQRVGRDTMRYAGSLLKYSLSEARRPKSAVLVDLGAKGDVNIELLPLRPLHDVRQISGTVDQLTSKEAVEANSTEGRSTDDYLYAVITEDYPASTDEARLRAVYPNLIGEDYTVLLQHTAGTEGGAMADIAALRQLSPLDIFDRFFTDMNGTGPNEEQQGIITAVFSAEYDRSEQQEDKR